MNHAKQFLNTIETSIQEPIRNHIIPCRNDALHLFSKEFNELPILFRDIYSECDGMTFDFFVGLKLMSSSEVLQAYRSGYHRLKEFGMLVIPFMKDKQGNHVIYAKIRDDEELVAYVKGVKVYFIAKSVDEFWNIALNLYNQNVYTYVDDHFSIDYDKLSKVFKELTIHGESSHL